MPRAKSSPRPRVCACGKPLAANVHITQCGSCSKQRIRNANTGVHTYARTHVHEWPGGHRTIELGVRCDGSDHR